jgi:hypothetical protein
MPRSHIVRLREAFLTLLILMAVAGPCLPGSLEVAVLTTPWQSNAFKWEVRLDAKPPDLIQHVQSVTYYLPVDFGNRRVRSGDPQNGFFIKDVGRGSFRIIAEIRLVNGNVIGRVVQVNPPAL